MINFDFQHECTGCSACADACPVSCISMGEDRDGFRMPQIDQDSCVGCGRCEKFCPALNYMAGTYTDRKCYVVYHRNAGIRHCGSSGSVFYALAENVILHNGVVYAAAMDDRLKLRHTRATDMSGVHRQMKSKYLQSDTQGVYKQVQKDLKDGTTVLFVGTPCQCQALHNIIPPSLRSKLVLADMICHGVPSQSLFDKSIAHYERQHGCKVMHFSFREKTTEALRNYKMTIRKEDGQVAEKIGDSDGIPFCLGYFNHVTQRHSCYNCRQRSIERASDLTLGDFWALEQLKPVDDFQKGYSSVIVNSQLGGAILEQLTTCVVEEIENGIDFVASHNHAYTKPDEEGLMRLFFFGSTGFSVS